MPASDRYWKGFVAFSTLAFCGSAIYLVANLIAPLLHGWPSLTWPPRHLTWKPLFDVTTVLPFALTMHLEGRRARERESRRTRAMRGDPTAMPPARFVADPGASVGAPLVRLQPPWQGERTATYRIGRLLMPGILLSLCLAFMLPVALTVRVLPSWSHVWLIIAAVIAMIAIWIVTIIRIAQRIKRHPASTALATPDGLASGSTGPSTLIAWDEAKLLEVTEHRSRGGSRRAFTLYSPTARITWHERPPRPATDAASSVSETSTGDPDGALALVELVIARTGLVPRTLTPSLMAEPDSTAISARPPTWRGLMGLIVVVGLCAGTAVLSIALPLTDVPFINLYVGGSFALLALYALGNGTRGLLHRFAPSKSSRTVVSSGRFADGPASAPAGDCGFIYRVPLLPWLGSLFLGLVLTLNLAGLMAAVPLAFSRDAASNQVRGCLMGFVLLVGIFGIAHIGSVLRRRSITLCATDDALTMRFRAATLAIRWSDVTAVVLESRGRRRATYTVSPGNETKAIEVSARWDRTSRPLPGAQFVRADELAAIVCHRSGKTLQIEQATCR